MHGRIAEPVKCRSGQEAGRQGRRSIFRPEGPRLPNGYSLVGGRLANGNLKRRKVLFDERYYLGLIGVWVSPALTAAPTRRGRVFLTVGAPE
jgi:hypothetical protein